MSYSFSASIMLAAGLGIPILASLNAALGQFIGSPVVAVIVLLGVAFLSICLISLTTNNFPMTKLIEAPKHLFVAGFFVVFYMLSVTAIAPHFGTIWIAAGQRAVEKRVRYARMFATCVYLGLV